MSKSILILVAFIVILFYPCLNADFINLDDGEHILGNLAVQETGPASIKLIFSQTVNTTYIPLTTLSFVLEKKYFGLNKFVFHLDNLLLFIGVVILVLLLAKRMGLSMEASFFAALIFAVHPMRVETVAWVTERKDVLYSLFYLLALHQYWSYLKTRSMKNYLFMALFGFFSMLAKPMALSLPLILLVFDWYYGRRISRRVVIEKVPIFMYMAFLAWLTLSLNVRTPIVDIFTQGPLVWVWTLVFYIRKFFFPFQLFPYYVLPHPISIFNWPYIVSIALFLILAMLLVAFRKNKLFIFSFLYFFLSIFFLLRLDGNWFNVVADRFMFLPSLGLCFFIGAWVDRHSKSRWALMVFYSVLVLMGIKTSLQCQIWHDSVSLWSAVIEEDPNYYRAYNNRGAGYFLKQEDDLALIDFNKAIALQPKGIKAYNNRGFVYYIRMEDDKALRDFNQAISLDPSYPPSYMNRSLLEAAQKKYLPALKDALMAKKLGQKVDDAYIKRLQQAQSNAFPK